jgi:N-acetylglucosamine kinase-like BadF-type ATPase
MPPAGPHGQGGWGYLLGDEGGGFWIGRSALTAVVRQFDGRGPATLLTPMILEHLDLSTPKQLIHEILLSRRSPPHHRGIAGLVQRAMDERDAIAAEILRHAGTELASAAGSVIGRLQMRGDAFPTVLAGGIFAALRGWSVTLQSGCPKLLRVRRCSGWRSSLRSARCVWRLRQPEERSPFQRMSRCP